MKKIFLCVLSVLCVLFSFEKASPVVDPNTLEKIDPAFAEASSVLKGALSKDKNEFSPDKAIDGKWETAWAEGVKGPGVREWIRLVLARPETINRIAIIPGWAKNRVRWVNNPRVKRATISFSTGYAAPAQFEDHMAFQFVETHYDKPVTWVQITVDEVYPGKKFEDLCISEIELYR